MLARDATTQVFITLSVSVDLTYMFISDRCVGGNRIKHVALVHYVGDYSNKSFEFAESSGLS
jgi:hypothetical protein